MNRKILLVLALVWYANYAQSYDRAAYAGRRLADLNDAKVKCVSVCDECGFKWDGNTWGNWANTDSEQEEGKCGCNKK
jgi:hypothetical protein